MNKSQPVVNELLRCTAPSHAKYQRIKARLCVPRKLQVMHTPSAILLAIGPLALAASVDSPLSGSNATEGLSVEQCVRVRLVY